MRGLDDYRLANRLATVGLQQRGEEAEAVFTGMALELLAGQISERREKVGETDRLLADGDWFDVPGPAGGEGHSVAAFPGVALHAAKAAGGVVTEPFDVGGIPDRAIVGG